MAAGVGGRRRGRASVRMSRVRLDASLLARRQVRLGRARGGLPSQVMKALRRSLLRPVCVCVCVWGGGG